ncbi:hypothetical protein [Streptomyces syringium]|uniref:hypothetical protein n=1 Tax=Streptomyces syringium TaxID=76729 RepID=UPI0033CF5484
MTGPADLQVLEEFSTGYQATRVTALPNGHIHWQHNLKTDREGSYPPLDPDLTDRFTAASDPHVRFAAPCTAQPTEYSWEIAGRHSLATVLLPDAPTPAKHLEVFAHLGRQLRALHDQPASTGRPDAYPAPRGPSRLMAWLDRGQGTRASAGFHHLLRSRLGPSRWEKLRGFTHHLLHPEPAEHTSVLHGWFSLGNLILADDPHISPRTFVLSGMDAAQGRPETDLAWLLGELAEYRKATERQGIDWPVLDTLQNTFLEHYGPGWNRDLVAAGSVVRIATHAHDFATYIGWGPQLHGYLPMLAELLDTDGATALPTA